MNRIVWTKKFGIVAVMILAILTSIQPSTCAECQLTMSWEPWPPFQYQDAEEKIKGVDIELTKSVMQHMGCDLQLQHMPWKRVMHEIESGRLEMSAGASITPERKEFAYFSEPYRRESFFPYVRKGETKKYPIERLEDIKTHNLRLGVVRGYHYGEAYERLMKDAAFSGLVQEVAYDHLNFKKLIHRRIDVFLGEPFFTAYELKNRNLADTVERLPFEIDLGTIHVIFSKKSVSPEIVEKFNESLGALKENGTYQRIVEKYLVGDL